MTRLPLLAILAWLSLPVGIAKAATVSVEPPGGFTLNAEPGEANDVTVTRRVDDDVVVFTDEGADLDAGPGCSQLAESVSCPDEETAGNVQLGDGPDTVDFTGVAARFPTIFWTVGLGTGDDTYRGQSLGLNRVHPGEGDDQLFGGAGGEEFYVASGVEGEEDGADFIDGLGAAPSGEGNVLDLVSYEGRDGALELSLDGVANDGAPGEGDQILNVSDLAGGGGADLITGDDRGNELFGSGGFDTIAGGPGGDRVDGGFGAPFGRTDNAASSLEGGPGRDRVYGTGGGGELDGGGSADLVGGGEGPEFLRGGPANDVVLGGGGEDLAQGGPDNDEVDGGRGDDSVRGQRGNDLVIGGFGDDVMRGGSGADTLSAAFILIGENQVRRRERGADQAGCGTGKDKALIDARDDARDCEQTKLFPEP